MRSTVMDVDVLAKRKASSPFCWGRVSEVIKGAVKTRDHTAFLKKGAGFLVVIGSLL